MSGKRDSNDDSDANANSAQVVDPTSIRGAQKSLTSGEGLWVNVDKQMRLYVERQQRYVRSVTKLSQTVSDLAQTEAPAVTEGLSKWAECMNNIEDRRRQLNVRLALAIESQLNDVPSLFKTMQDDVKLLQKKQARHKTKQSNLMRLTAKAQQDRTKISQAQVELEGAAMEQTRATDSVLSAFTDFEKQKVGKMKKMVEEFLHAHIEFHVHSLEQLSNAYTAISDVDETDVPLDTVLKMYNLTLVDAPPSSSNNEKGSADKGKSTTEDENGKSSTDKGKSKAK